MPFELVHVRFQVGSHPLRPIVVLASNSHYSQMETSLETARAYITNSSKASDVALFVVIFGQDGLLVKPTRFERAYGAISDCSKRGHSQPI